jgi:mercuric ion transport protein
MAILNSGRSLIAGILAAVGASVCCVGPLLLLTLGIGGAWVGSLTAFEPFRPYLIVATLVFLGVAFHRLYLAPQVCEPGTPCADPRTRTRQRVIFWTVSVLIVGLLAVPYVAPIFLL